MRFFEILAITSFFLLTIGGALRLVPVAVEHPVWVAASLLVGWIAADFGSGLVHWAGDTWGTTDTPVVGQSLIRTFREHHVDQQSITRHDFVETNGANCMATLPFLLAVALVDLEGPGPVRVFGVCFALMLSVWVFLTNQIHSWAHTDHPPRFVAWLQRVHLILPPDHHQRHHTAPFDRYYCITTGWLNPLLLRTDFFRRAERVIGAVTGAVPRRDDIGLEAALAIAPAAIGPPERVSEP